MQKTLTITPFLCIYMTLLWGCSKPVANSDIESLKSLPYLQWTEEVNPKSGGVVNYIPKKSSPGYNLYHNYTDTVYLMNMEGEIKHTWTIENVERFQVAKFTKGGNLIVVGDTIFQLDWDSTLMWDASAYGHHDFAFLPDKSFYALTTDPPRDFNGYQLLFDSIVHISKNGDNLGIIWSSYEHKDELDQYYTQPQFTQNPDEENERRNNEHKEYEYFHINTIHIIENNRLAAIDLRFQPGNIMLCFRNVDLIVILDKNSWDVVWAWGPEALDWPHMPSLLPNGNILVFDNGPHRGYSRILEINPVNLQYVWQYPPENDSKKSFLSNDRGSCLRLSNGNTLIGISEKARAIEVTLAGEIVWEFLNPLIESGRRQTFYRMTRYPQELLQPYLEASRMEISLE